MLSRATLIQILGSTFGMSAIPVFTDAHSAWSSLCELVHTRPPLGMKRRVLRDSADQTDLFYANLFGSNLRDGSHVYAQIFFFTHGVKFPMCTPAFGALTRPQSLWHFIFLGHSGCPAL